MPRTGLRWNSGLSFRMKSLSHVFTSTVKLLQLLRPPPYSIFIYSEATQMPVRSLGCREISTVWGFEQRAEDHLSEHWWIGGASPLLPLCRCSQSMAHAWSLLFSTAGWEQVGERWIPSHIPSVQMCETGMQWGTGGWAQGREWVRAKLERRLS